ncbi:hypothetical protein BASA50_007640 [Batrachochytrium salamandrivorans]|uniref:B30.2/SPRY domain-containing protein n=1 Tax=Batrachochytrium salamandrivorans TaxID=1357716 RepID=A0ABQ8F6F5_9FUNG|nr:hypothetical protein BASA50_007640 [Batrachochytrium salamandrivorans]
MATSWNSVAERSWEQLPDLQMQPETIATTPIPGAGTTTITTGTTTTGTVDIVATTTDGQFVESSLENTTVSISTGPSDLQATPSKIQDAKASASFSFQRDRTAQLSIELDIEHCSPSPMSIAAKSESTYASTSHSPTQSCQRLLVDEAPLIDLPPAITDSTATTIIKSRLPYTPSVINTISTSGKSKPSVPEHTDSDGLTCYCKQIREDKRRPMLQCVGCSSWFHQVCIESTRSWNFGLLLGDDYYQFTCKNCGAGTETMRRYTLSWGDVVQIVLFNLTQTMEARKVSSDGRKFYNWRQDICTFIDRNWEIFWLKSRPNTWRNSVASCLSTSSRFVSGVKHFDSEQGLWALDVNQFPSAAEQSRRTRVCGYFVRPDGSLLEEEVVKKERKRKKIDEEQPGISPVASLEVSMLTEQQQQQQQQQKSTKQKLATVTMAKTHSQTPSEISADSTSLAKRSKRPAKPKKTTDQAEIIEEQKDIDLATAIMIYPDVDNPGSEVVMSHQPTHTAPQIKFSDGGRQVQNEKGYRMAKASHGVWDGYWYFEVKKENAAGHCRVGWSQISGDLQGPCGYDQFSYSYRDQPGTLFHQSRQVKDAPELYAEGYGQGDVLGMSIYFPPCDSSEPATPEQASDHTDQPSSQPQLHSQESAQQTKPIDEKVEEMTQLAGQANTQPLLYSETDLSSRADCESIAEPLVSGGTHPLSDAHSRERASIQTQPQSQSPHIAPPQSQSQSVKLPKVHPVLLNRLWDAVRMLQYMPFRSNPLEVLPGTEIQFFKNGVALGIAFRDIYQGKYHPAVSLFGGALVSVNFGPNFAYPIPKAALPFSQVRSLGSWNKLRDANRRRHAKEAQLENGRKQAQRSDRKQQRGVKSFTAAPDKNGVVAVPVETSSASTPTVDLKAEDHPSSVVIADSQPLTEPVDKHAFTTAVMANPTLDMDEVLTLPRPADSILGEVAVADPLDLQIDQAVSSLEATPIVDPVIKAECDQAHELKMDFLVHPQLFSNDREVYSPGNSSFDQPAAGGTIGISNHDYSDHHPYVSDSKPHADTFGDAHTDPLREMGTSQPSTDNAQAPTLTRDDTFMSVMDIVDRDTDITDIEMKHIHS